MRPHGEIIIGIVVASAVLVRPSGAQSYATDRGAWQVGGTGTLSHSSVVGDGAGTTTAVLAPRLGFFVAPGIAVLAQLPLSYAATPNGHSVGYGAGPGLTYHFGRGSRALYPYVGASVAAEATRDYVEGISGPVNRINALTWQGSGGGVVMAARNVGVGGELYYARNRSTVTSALASTKRTSTTLEYGVRFAVSVFVY